MKKVKEIGEDEYTIDILEFKGWQVTTDNIHKSYLQQAIKWELRYL